MNEWGAYVLSGFGAAILVWGLAGLARCVWLGVKLWRLKHENRQAHSQNGGGAQGHAGAGAGAGAPAFPQGTSPGQVTCGNCGSTSPAGAFARWTCSCGSVAVTGSGLLTLAPGANLSTSFMALDDRVSFVQCDLCEAVHNEGEAHECVALSDVDTAAVRTIRELCAAGLSPEEIAEDMGVVLGWRWWRKANDGLRGLGTGQIAAWKFDEPMRAVCTDTMCRGRRTACGGVVLEGYDAETKPICRIHALKGAPPQRGIEHANYTASGHILGLVALWGEVIECESGYLATRAYPLALSSELMARAYRVGVLKQEKAA